MAEDPRKIMEMSDDELRFWTLSGNAGTYVFEMGQTEMHMRCSLRMVEASKETAAANRELVQATNSLIGANRGLVEQTKNLVKATWGVVTITFLTQIALIYLTVTRK